MSEQLSREDLVYAFKEASKESHKKTTLSSFVSTWASPIVLIVGLIFWASTVRNDVSNVQKDVSSVQLSLKEIQENKYITKSDLDEKMQLWNELLEAQIQLTKLEIEFLKTENTDLKKEISDMKKLVTQRQLAYNNFNNKKSPDV